MHVPRVHSQSDYYHFHAVFGKNYSKQECIPVGCVASAAVAVCWVGGVYPGGSSVCLVGGLPGTGGGICPGGVYQGGVSKHALRQTPPPL